jgi:hypothetical protein
MKRLAICCWFFLTSSFVSVSHADTILEENWNSGTIDSGVWTLSTAAETNNAYVVIDALDGDPEATGDKALMFNGSSTWAETLESVATYNRDTGGDGLVIEFTTWVEGGVGAPGQGFNGPFHNPAATIAPASIELGTTWNWQSHQWSEDGTFNAFDRSNQDPAHQNWPLYHSGFQNIDSNTWQSRFGHSNDKNDAVRVRYTLGATQGGMFEWFNTNIDAQSGEEIGWVVEGDFRDGTLGQVIPDNPFRQGTSTLATVRLAWFSFAGGNPNTETDDQTGVVRNGVFIDDILLYAGAPTTPPTGACNLTGSCQILTEADCLAQSGTYDGDDTVCATVFNIPGDCNQDGALDLSDVVCLLGHLFQGNPSSLPCSTEDATKTLLDCNGDGSIDLSDAIFKLTFLFQGGLPPEGGEGCIAIPDCPQNAGCL